MLAPPPLYHSANQPVGATKSEYIEGVANFARLCTGDYLNSNQPNNNNNTNKKKSLTHHKKATATKKSPILTIEDIPV